MAKILHAKTKTAVCAAIPCSRTTLDKWLDAPGFPKFEKGKGWPVIACRKFLSEETRAATKNKEATPIQAGKARLVELDVMGRELDWEIKNRTYRPVSEMIEAIQAVDTVIVREIRKAIEHELPPILEGMTAIEIQRELKAALNKCFARLPEKLAKLK